MIAHYKSTTHKTNSSKIKVLITESIDLEKPVEPENIHEMDKFDVLIWIHDTVLMKDRAMTEHPCGSKLNNNAIEEILAI